ncbi:Zinc finger C2H2-type, partial [Trinorchestia longiramus]
SSLQAHHWPDSCLVSFTQSSLPRVGGLKRGISQQTGPSFRGSSVLGLHSSFASLNTQYSSVQNITERPHACSYCCKRFKEKHHLRQHVLLHTGEKPFVCTMCEARFVQVGHLKRHQFRHHFQGVSSLGQVKSSSSHALAVAIQKSKPPSHDAIETSKAASVNPITDT